MNLTDANKTDVGAQPPPGIYTNVPAAQYFAWPYLSKSAISDFARSPARWYALHTGELQRKTSDSYTLGSATDLLWVEQLDLTPANGWQIIPAINPQTDKPLPASGAARNAYLEHVRAQGLTPISQAMASKALAMRDALDRNERACALREGATPQVSLVWDCPYTGLRLKGRPDLPHLTRRTLPDLKTTRDIRPWAFDGDASSYNYHWQLHLYAQGLAANGCGDYEDWRHWLITVDNAPMHGVACRPMELAALELARDEVTAHLQRWLRCRTANYWPADLLDEKPIELPRWRFKFTGRIDG